MRKSGWFISLSVISGSFLVVAACQQSAPPAAAAPHQAPYAPTTTIKDLMLNVIDPAADVVWLSVTTVQSADGTVETAPKTEEDWLKVRQGAITLVEAANLLMIPGRHVAKPGEKSEVPGVELEPSEMEEMINKDRAAWDTRAVALHDAATAVLAAAEAKDAAKVFEIGERIELACEGCHKHFWYPNEVIPEFPSSQ